MSSIGQSLEIQLNKLKACEKNLFIGRKVVNVFLVGRPENTTPMELYMRRSVGLLFLSFFITSSVFASSYEDHLYSGEVFFYEEWLRSPDNSTIATFHHPGSLVLLRHGNVIWKSGHHAGSECVMQRDGNLVVRAKTRGNAPPEVQWSSGTSGNPGAYLQVTNEGKMVIIGQGGTILWSVP
jgi:hypothetical protein